MLHSLFPFVLFKPESLDSDRLKTVVHHDMHHTFELSKSQALDKGYMLPSIKPRISGLQNALDHQAIKTWTVSCA